METNESIYNENFPSVFMNLLDVDKIKQMIADCPKDEIVIICPNYSINIQSAYADCPDSEQIDWDWNDFEEAIGQTMQVNDYDDLICDPNNLIN